MISNCPLTSDMWNVKKNNSFNLRSDSPRATTDYIPQPQLSPVREEVSCNNLMPYRYLEVGE